MLPLTSYKVVRYGNVANSNGSVIPVFKKYYDKGEPFPITHLSMTRYWIELDEAAQFVLSCVDGESGKVFTPKMPSFKVVDLAEAFTDKDGKHPGTRITGIRPGEKLHEQINEEEFSNINDIWLNTKKLRTKLKKLGVLR